MKEVTKYSLFLICALFCIVSCSDEQSGGLSSEYLCDSVKVTRQITNDITFSAFTDPRISDEKISDNSENLISVRFRIEMNQKNISISGYKIPDTKAYSDRIRYLSFDIRNDLYLVCNTETIPCVDAINESTGNNLHYTDIIAVFTRPVSDEYQFVYDDKQFGTGPIKLMITN